LEFYAELLYKSKMLGGPKEFDKANIKKLYEIRRQFGMPGKHPANLCLNKGKDNCHNCGACEDAVAKHMPGYEFQFGCNSGDVDEKMVADIVKKIVAEMK